MTNEIVKCPIIGLVLAIKSLVQPMSSAWGYMGHLTHTRTHLGQDPKSQPCSLALISFLLRQSVRALRQFFSRHSKKFNNHTCSKQLLLALLTNIVSFSWGGDVKDLHKKGETTVHKGHTRSKFLALRSHLRINVRNLHRSILHSHHPPGFLCCLHKYSHVTHCHCHQLGSFEEPRKFTKQI